MAAVVAQRRLGGDVLDSAAEGLRLVVLAAPESRVDEIAPQSS
jgi:hypothetical protein